MRTRLGKALINPRKALNYISVAIKNRMRKKKGVLIFIGMDPMGEFDLLYPGYKSCYGFEANPARFKKLMNRYKKYNHIKLFNVAVADYDGAIDFNISSNNDGASSSLGNFNEEWRKSQPLDDFKMIKKIKVPCINLLNFCKKNNIEYIDDYISDLQGMDLQVLKTLRALIERKAIGTIRCEVTKNKYKNIYFDLPDNSEKGFNDLLNEYYQLISIGKGILNNNRFDKIPEDSWEMDCKWIRRDTK